MMLPVVIHSIDSIRGKIVQNAQGVHIVRLALSL